MDIEFNQENTNEDYFTYLDILRESGATNMFSAIPYLLEEFSELSEVEAKKVLKNWMETFSERHRE